MKKIPLIKPASLDSKPAASKSTGNDRHRYLIVMVAALLLMAKCLWPYVPHLIKAVVPFPASDNLPLIQGVFDYEGDETSSEILRYFVVNQYGRMEFTCGYPTHRWRCYTKPSVFKGHPIRVQQNWWYGAVDYQISTHTGRPHPMDSRGGRSWDTSRVLHSDPNFPRIKSVNWLGALLMAALFIASLLFEVRRRLDKKNPNLQLKKENANG